MYIVFTVSQFHADVHSVYLVFLFDTTILSEKALGQVICSDKTSNQAKAKNLSNFTLLIVYLFVRFLHVRSISIYCNFFFFLYISFDLQKERTKERKEEPFFSNRELLSTRKH